MVTFFKHIGIGIISAFTAFTGAFHTQNITTTPNVQTGSSTNATVSQKIILDSATQDKEKTPVSSPVQTVAAPKIQAPQPIPAQDSTNYYSYQNLPSGFSRNPPFYLSQKVKLSGRVIDFMAAGDRGGSSNYLEIAVDSGVDVPYFALSVDAASYQRVVQGVNKGDEITAYGTISPSKYFLNSDQITTTLLPVLTIYRIDNCTGSNPCVITPGHQTVIPITYSPNTVSNDDTVSLGHVFLNPDKFLGTKIKTIGKVIRILVSDSSSNSLIFIQDPNDGRGLALFTAESAYLINNQIKVGTNLTLTGIILSPRSSEALNTVSEFHLVDTSDYFLITNGTINVN